MRESGGDKNKRRSARRRPAGSGIGGEESELERMKSKERAGEWWPEAKSCLIGDGWSRCDGQSEGSISVWLQGSSASIFLDNLVVLSLLFNLYYGNYIFI